MARRMPVAEMPYFNWTSQVTVAARAAMAWIAINNVKVRQNLVISISGNSVKPDPRDACSIAPRPLLRYPAVKWRRMTEAIGNTLQGLPITLVGDFFGARVITRSKTNACLVSV